MESITTAISLLGGLSAAARAIGVTPQALNQWSNGVRPIPLERCVDIERATQRKVTCEQLRPDKADYWAYLRAASSSESTSAGAAA